MQAGVAQIAIQKQRASAGPRETGGQMAGQGGFAFAGQGVVTMTICNFSVRAACNKRVRAVSTDSASRLCV